jgi:hypothetical protein
MNTQKKNTELRAHFEKVRSTRTTSMATMVIAVGGRLWTMALMIAEDGQCQVTFPAMPNLFTKCETAAAAKSVAERCVGDYLASLSGDPVAVTALLAAEQQARTDRSMPSWDIEQELMPVDDD